MADTTILIVDDSPDIRALLKKLLQQKGYRTVEAPDGYQAIQLARQHRPDLIITDLGLPGLDGWELTHRVRTDPALEEIPIIAMTGYGILSAAQAAVAAGCQRVIFKPLNITCLEQEIQEFMAQHTAANRCNG